MNFAGKLPQIFQDVKILLKPLDTNIYIFGRKLSKRRNLIKLVSDSRRFGVRRGAAAFLACNRMSETKRDRKRATGRLTRFNTASRKLSERRTRANDTILYSITALQTASEKNR
jgi:hypothetical protein